MSSRSSNARRPALVRLRKTRRFSAKTAASFSLISTPQRSIDKRIRIHQSLQATRPTVLGDPTQLQNALLNLALNARDAMPNGGDLVFETDLTALDAGHCRNSNFDISPGTYLCVRITDTGCGMSEEVKTHLFEPFFTTKEPGKGTGMGLASVYGTIQNHQGPISVSSQINEGTTFRVCLPCAASAAKPAPKKPASLSAQGAARILLIDDEPIVRSMGSVLLENLGYVVTACAAFLNPRRNNRISPRLSDRGCTGAKTLNPAEQGAKGCEAASSTRSMQSLGEAGQTGGAFHVEFGESLTSDASEKPRTRQVSHERRQVRSAAGTRQ